MKIAISVLLLSLLFPLCSYGQSAGGHAIQVQLTNYHGGWLYLGNYFGKQTYVIDSAAMDAKGTAVFKGGDTLPGGIYFILLPDKRRYFELLIDKQQHFSIAADTADNFRHIVFSHDADNELFGKYNAFLRKEQQKAEAAREGKDFVALRNEKEKKGKK